MKTKTMKRLAAAVAAITMMSAVPMMSMHDVVNASSIKINTGAEAHDYLAYQIFKGDLSTNNENKKVLSNIQWGSAVVKKGANDTDIYNISDQIYAAFELTGDNKTIPKLIDKIKNGDIQDVSNKINDVIMTHNKAYTTNTISNTLIRADSDAAATTVPDGDGYYLLVDAASTYSVLSANLMEIAGDVTVTPKMSKPTLNKDVKDVTSAGAESWGDVSTATIGKPVEYKLTSAVPDMTGYNKYFYIVNDKLSPGMVLDPSTIKVTVGGVEKTKDTDYYVETYDAGSGTNENYLNAFRLVFKNFIDYQNLQNRDIVITYSAILGGANGAYADQIKYGITTSDSNKNTVNLIYSNNPNHEYKGNSTKPDEPPIEDKGPGSDDDTPYDPTDDTPKNDNPADPSDPTNPDPFSKTPEDIVYTYTAKLEVTKTQNDKTTALSGAGFTLYKDSVAANNKIGDQIINDSGNTFEFKGLGAGKYILVESKVPTGFNKADDIEFTIDATAITSGSNKNDITWSPEENAEGKVVTFSSSKSEFITTVINMAGTTLPSTGGIGTTIFYVSGGVLVLGAGVVLITKKRMSLKDDK